MGYLERRIQFLIQQLEEGNVKLLDSFAVSETGKQLIHDLSKVWIDEDGSIDISTCSPLVRATAKALFAMEHYERLDEASEDEHVSEPASPEDVAQVMKEYFSLLEEFFLEATGISPQDFDFEVFKSEVLSDFEKQANKSRIAFEKYPPKIAKFHSSNTSRIYKGSKYIGGLKSVLGGSSRFPRAAFVMDPKNWTSP